MVHLFKVIKVNYPTSFLKIATSVMLSVNKFLNLPYIFVVSLDNIEDNFDEKSGIKKSEMSN